MLEGRSGLAEGWRPDASHLDGLSAAVVATDGRGTVIYSNTAAEAMYGVRADQLAGAAMMDLLVAPAAHDQAVETLAAVLAGDGWTGELAMRCTGGVVRTVRVTASPLRHDDAIAGALYVAEELRTVGGDFGLGDRLSRLARVTAELGLAEDVAAVTEIVISHAADAVGAVVATLSLLVDDETLELVGLRGGPPGTAERWASFPVDDETPAGEAVRTGERVVLIGRDTIHRRYPRLATPDSGDRSIVCLPLRSGGRAMGAFSLTFPGQRGFGGVELELFSMLADNCAQSLDRIRARAEAADRAAKLGYLADASAELASTLDYETTLTNVVRLAVPDFADWCSIQLVDDDRLRTLAVAHVDPSKVALAHALEQRYPADPDAPGGAYQVVRTGVGVLIPEITDAMLVAGAQDEEHLRLSRELRLRSALAVPLVARGRVLGVYSWVAAESGRRYDAADQKFAEDLAARAAIAIDNAQLHSETRQAAHRLQRAVLPEELPVLPGWEVAGHYSPAGRTEVGGDFYDVIPLDKGRVAVFVGDVMGRGVAAAAAMAQMRAAVRAYIATDPAPEVVMTHLDSLFEKFQIAQLVTLVYVVVDPAADELQVMNAGHLPPLVLRQDGSVDQLPMSDGPPLGVGPAQRLSVRIPFRDGDTLLAYTDGLIELRTEDIDAGLARLVAQAPGLAADDLSAGLADLVEAVRDDTRDDDIAALAVRRG